MILAELELLKATNLEAVDFSLKTNCSQRIASLSSTPLKLNIYKVSKDFFASDF